MRIELPPGERRSGLAWVLWTRALHCLPAGAAGMGTLAVPVIGVAAAWIVLGERPVATEAAGIVLIVIALAALAAHELAAGRGDSDATDEGAVLPPVVE